MQYLQYLGTIDIPFVTALSKILKTFDFDSLSAYNVIDLNFVHTNPI